MSLFEELKELGVDVDEGLERVMEDKSLYEMTLSMFVDSVNNNPIRPEDFDADNIEELIRRVHLLKGLSGNLAMTPLFTRYTQVLEFLRDGQREVAKAGFERIPAVQTAIIDCIKRYISA